MATPKLSNTLAQQAMDLTKAHGSQAAASRALGIPLNTFRSRYATAVKYGLTPAVMGLLAGEAASAPEGMGLKKVTTQYDEDGAPVKQWVGNTRMSEKVRDVEDPPKLLDGMMLKGISTFYDGDGRKTAEWVLQRADAEKQEAILSSAIKALCETIPPLAPISGPTALDSDLLTVYTLTDCHIGMLSWDKETGADWDLTIAERCLAGTLIRMIDAAPPSRDGLVNELGDFEHFDSLTPETPAHRHVLDADSRFQKMIQVSIRILRRVIEHALTKHERVFVQIKEGNHDPAASAWKRVMFSMLYADNPRVFVDMSPNPYTIHEHGKTLLGFYHGHLAKLPSLPQLFAAQFREAWGRCQFVYVHTGHKHHVSEVEYPGVKLIQHPTLAAPDAYAARGGWLSKRQATSMTYHRELGEVARGIFIPEEIKK